MFEVKIDQVGYIGRGMRTRACGSIVESRGHCQCWTLHGSYGCSKLNPRHTSQIGWQIDEKTGESTCRLWLAEIAKSEVVGAEVKIERV